MNTKKRKKKNPHPRPHKIRGIDFKQDDQIRVEREVEREELKGQGSKRKNECKRRGKRKGKVDPNPINTHWCCPSLWLIHMHTHHTYI